MKNLIYLFSMMFFLSVPFSANAQWNIKEKAKKKLEEKLSESKQKEKEEQETEVTKQDVSDENASDKEISGTAEQPQTPEEQLKAWSNYNFVPGDKVIFEDNLLWEENGEFPSKWDLMRGIAENAMIGNEKVIKFSVDEDIIFPLMETEEDYLPEKFTIEFDAYFNREIDENGNPTEDWETKYYVWLWNIKNLDTDVGGAYPSNDGLRIITLDYRSVEMDRFNGEIPRDPSEEKLSSKWRHVAIEFNIRSLKVYLDQHRLLNIPNIKCNPSAFFLGNESDDVEWIPGAPDVLIKNIRIAEGGKKYYERFMTDGKIVTTGIKFASGKSDVKPESMGVINKIVQLMNQHPEVNFSIEGHTDSDGDETLNQTLSEKRAEAIKAEFVRLGISDNRLKTNGWGESKPVDENSTPEGKANNRRVEFVKF